MSMKEESQKLIQRDSYSQKDSQEEEKDGQFNDALKASEQQLKVYPQRYLMAVLYSFMALAISLQQSMYAAEGASLKIIYNTSGFLINSNQIIHMLLHFPLSFPANYIVDKFGIKVGVLIAGFLLLIGSWVRCLVNAGGNSFWISVVGGVFIGTANPFIINSLNKVSANWFYPSQRPGVTSFLSFFSTVTGLVGIFLPGIWFSGFECETKDDGETNCDIEKGKQLMFSLSIVLASMVSALVIPSMLFFKAKPPTPPSFVDDEEREDFGVALKVLAKDKIYLLQSFVFAIFYGSFQDMASFLAFILEPYKLGDSLYTSILCGVPVLSGIFGCIVSSKYLAKTQRYKRAVILCQIGSILGLISFATLLNFENFYILLPCVAILGFAIIPMIPTVTEWACETSYPIGEPTVTGFIWAIAHIFAGTTGLGYTAMLDTGERLYIQIMFIIVGVLFVAACGLTFFINAPLKRLKAEKEKSEQMTAESQSDTSSQVGGTIQ